MLVPSDEPEGLNSPTARFPSYSNGCTSASGLESCNWREPAPSPGFRSRSVTGGLATAQDRLAPIRGIERVLQGKKTLSSAPNLLNTAAWPRAPASPWLPPSWLAGGRGVRLFCLQTPRPRAQYVIRGWSATGSSHLKGPVVLQPASHRIAAPPRLAPPRLALHARTHHTSSRTAHMPRACAGMHTSHCTQVQAHTRTHSSLCIASHSSAV